MTTVIACSSPQKKLKKFKYKSVEGRKVTHSPDLSQEVLPQTSELIEPMMVRRQGAGRCSQRSGVSLARRVAGPLNAVAVVGQKGAQRFKGHEQDSAQVRYSGKQAQPARESGMECHAAILEEGELGDAVKMAAPSERIIPVPGNLEERQLDPAAKIAACKELVVEEVIVISDKEMERQDGSRMEWYDDKLQLVGQLGKMVSRSIRGSLCQEVRDGSFGSQSVFKVGEQVEFID
ncbi:hypothetical protein NDU88_005874 [Pleurodeles waltl]|uniref:Uncharacterized protein n=1 Tax=Pleurodeles waltl TaxID=8319 RepID=A0AAV7UJD2_PLEWA|nr:hypothetical protein NDU88_005874 [Pleurodeles waltl]